MHNCENCMFRGTYDKSPGSILGRIWKWHIRWCPGWKSYVKSLPDERRLEILEKYNQASATRSTESESAIARSSRF